MGAATLLSTLPMQALAKNSDPTTTVISTFEDGTEGWRTNGGNKLGRASSEAFGGLVGGSYGLAVLTQGDAYSMIENMKRIQKADFVDSPYLVADVLPAVADSGSNVTFQFQLHHLPIHSGKQGRKSGTSNNGRPRVVTSPMQVVPQYRKSQLSWDLSDVSTEARANAKRLELRWHLTDENPKGAVIPIFIIVIYYIQILRRCHTITHSPYRG